MGRSRYTRAHALRFPFCPQGWANQTENHIVIRRLEMFDDAATHACPANVTQQREMLVLLVILAGGCLTFWTQRTFLKGWLFRSFDNTFGTKFAAKLVLNPEDYPGYWKGIACFLLGQGAAYFLNLLYTTLSEEQVIKVLGVAKDPLSLYLAIMIPDDIIGSLFRFGTWNVMFKRLQSFAGTSHRCLVTRNEPDALFKLRMSERELWIDASLFLFHSGFWCIQVILSVSFSFAVSASAFMLLGESSPTGALFTLFTNMQYESCAMKLLTLAIPTRFGLEALHACIAPPLIRYLSRTESTSTSMH